MTGSIVYNLDNTAQKQKTILYYDDKDRVVFSCSNNHLGGYDRVHTAYTFTGLPDLIVNKHTTASGSDVTEQYDNNYDHAGKLLSTDSFNESLSYDKNGNILSLNRTSGNAVIYDLAYEYSGNMIRKITDNAPTASKQGGYNDKSNVAREYFYDNNGSMTKDLDREVIVKYNLLNLPKRVTTSGSDSLLNYKTYNYDATGRKLQVKSFANDSTTLTEDYIGNKIYENSSLSKVLIPGGYVSIAGGIPTIHYYQTDHLGNIRQVLSSDGVLQEQNDYYAFGMRQIRGDYPLLASNKYKYNGKELETFNNFETLDFGARFYGTEGRFMTVDPLAEKRPWMSPYVFCSDNPVNRIDMDGNWDVSVHLAQNRSQNGYGVAIVTDRNGNEVYRFQVRAEGTGGRNRMNENADTPLGTYDIPDKNPWGTGGSRASYGPNARLNMTPESGEIEESGRDAIRIHGGQQEVYDSKTGKWTPSDNPELKKTHGCLRAFDTDMSAFKKITDNLQKTDSKEIPGQVTISADLDKLGTPTKTESVNGVNVQYYVPESQVKYWQYLIDSTFGKKNNGGQQ